MPLVTCRQNKINTRLITYWGWGWGWEGFPSAKLPIMVTRQWVEAQPVLQHECKVVSKIVSPGTVGHPEVLEKLSSLEVMPNIKVSGYRESKTPTPHPAGQVVAGRCESRTGVLQCQLVWELEVGHWTK